MNDPILRTAMLNQYQVTPDGLGLEMGQPISYEEAMKQKQQADAAAMQAKSAKAQQSSGITEAGQTATLGGAATANPFVAGAGIALQGIGMVDDAKRRDEQAQIDAYNNKIMAQRAAIRNIFA